MAINHQALAQNQTYKSYYGNILQFCFDRVEKILAGYDPLKDLVKANLIPRHFENMTCADVSNEALGNSKSNSSNPQQWKGTKFEELTDIISRKKNNSADVSKKQDSDILEVAGADSSKTLLLFRIARL